MFKEYLKLLGGTLVGILIFLVVLALILLGLGGLGLYKIMAGIAQPVQAAIITGSTSVITTIATLLITQISAWKTLKKTQIAQNKQLQESLAAQNKQLEKTFAAQEEQREKTQLAADKLKRDELNFNMRVQAVFEITEALENMKKTYEEEELFTWPELKSNLGLSADMLNYAVIKSKLLFPVEEISKELVSLADIAYYAKNIESTLEKFGSRQELASDQLTIIEETRDKVLAYMNKFFTGFSE